MSDENRGAFQQAKEAELDAGWRAFAKSIRSYMWWIPTMRVLSVDRESGVVNVEFQDGDQGTLTMSVLDSCNFEPGMALYTYRVPWYRVLWASVRKWWKR